MSQVYTNDPNSPNFAPISNFVGPMCTDLYQITMAYSYWKTGKHNQMATFDLYFRKSPFDGQYTIFAGLEECIKFVSTMKFTDSDIAYLKTIMPHCEPEFFEWLQSLDARDVSIYAFKEGTVCFPRVPMIIVEGPLAVCQLLETTFLNLVNFPSLIATNAARHKLVAKGKRLLEFGLRRAQGPDGAMSASRYAVMGGFEGTSNVLAGKLFDLKISGTHAHAFVTSFLTDETLKSKILLHLPSGERRDFVEEVERKKKELGYQATNESELTAFTAYAICYPHNCLCLVDTYDTLRSGVPNFLIVAAALKEFGYKAIGIRLDSGDLAYFSREARKMFIKAGSIVKDESFRSFSIIASNDLTVNTILSLNAQGHEIDVFAVGTNLVTCQEQPALGCVYKLVQIENTPRIKLSNEIDKVTLPCVKDAFRLYNSEGIPVVDLMVKRGMDEPVIGNQILCQHPFAEHKRAYVIPSRVEPLYTLYWKGKVMAPLPPLSEIQSYVKSQLANMREDHLRTLNPTPYKVSISGGLYKELHRLWLQEAPIPLL